MAKRFARQVYYRGLEFELVKVALRKVLKLRLLIAVALIGWCAGASCLTVSYARSAMAEIEDSAQALEQSISGSAKSAGAHACCKARHKSLKRTTIASQARQDSAEQSQMTLPSTPAPGNAMRCCPLTSGNILVASRYHSHEKTLAAAQNGSSVVFLISFIPKPVAVPLRLPNRDQSYLLGCAFLI
jgi:hypothetical protein